jgi:tRNA threonylcarbamoyladenosine biosynthesis protein TsaE
MHKAHTTSSAEETKKLAEMLVSELKKPCTILLFGELGSGKTTFVKGIARAFNIEERAIKSPTFTYTREINLPNQGTLHHLDLYRCAEDSDQQYLELDQKSGDWTVIEWPEYLHEKPAQRIECHFKITGDESREITTRHYG